MPYMINSSPALLNTHTAVNTACTSSSIRVHRWCRPSRPSYAPAAALLPAARLQAAAAGPSELSALPAASQDPGTASQAAGAVVSVSPVAAITPFSVNTAAAAAAAAKQDPAAEQLSTAADVDEAAVPHFTATHRLAGCPQCGGSGRVVCKECDGRGFLKRGGYNKKNPLPMNRITGSKWTAMEQTLGWRHFRVIQQRKLDKHTVFLLLQASCDSNTQLWVNAQSMRNRAAWSAGWLQMSEIQGLGAAVGSGHKCMSCSGLGFKVCQTCDGTGRAQLIVL